MLAPVAFLLGLALVVTAVYGLAGPWWACMAGGAALVLVAWLLVRGEARQAAPSRGAAR